MRFLTWISPVSLLASLVLTGMVSGCATKPLLVVPRPDPHLTCGSPMMRLYFVEGSDRLAFPTNYALGNYPDLLGVCGPIDVTVYGLEGPAEDSLDGRRARTVEQLVQSLGWPRPSFKRGNQDDQKDPAIFVTLIEPTEPR